MQCSIDPPDAGHAYGMGPDSIYSSPCEADGNLYKRALHDACRAGHASRIV